MRLLIRFSHQESAELRERQINVNVVGDLEDLPVATREAVEELIAKTNALPPGVEPAMTLSLALSYGGRRDVVDVIRAAAVRARAGLLLPEDIDERWLRQQLTTRELPDVDLLIRTGGEQRVSDFLLVESAYAELYFTDVLWPDFSERELWTAFESFSRRERRFGKTGEQVRVEGMQ
jgi:undecaprenyl diphosphate synthase